MTAMDFRAIVASDEARAFRREATRQRIRDMEASFIREEATRQRIKELQIPKAASTASVATRGEEEGQRHREVPRRISSGDQVQRTTSLPSSSTRVAAGEVLMHPDREIHGMPFNRRIVVKDGVKRRCRKSTGLRRAVAKETRVESLEHYVSQSLFG